MSDPNTIAGVQARYAQLDTAGQSWVRNVTAEAEAAGVGFSAKHTKSARRFETLVAVVQLARDGVSDDDVRELLALIVGDVALFPTVPLGHIIGSLNATEAAQFAGLATGRLCATYTDTGKPVIAVAA